MAASVPLGPSHALALPLPALPVVPERPRPSLWRRSRTLLAVAPALLLGCLSVAALACGIPAEPSAATTAVFAVPLTTPSPLRPIAQRPPVAVHSYGGNRFRQREAEYQRWEGQQRIVRPPPPPPEDDEWEPQEDLGEPLPPTTRPDLKTLVDPNIDPRVVDAVDRLGGKVTVADVAAASGVSLATATGAVRDMAYLTGAGVLVTDKGELLYNFGPGVKARLAASSLRAAAAQAYEKAAPVLGKLGRITFGVALFASLAVIFTSITMLQTSSRSDRDRDDRGGFFAPRMWWGPDIWIIPEPYYGYGPRRREMSFIESVYSFVFGDGDPNFNLEERRYRQIAQLIRENGGAVTAEQLAPYLDPPARWLERDKTEVVDEAFVAPALTRFNGRAEVTAAGDIVYVFDELRPTTARPTSALPVAPVLQEREQEFSRATGLNLFLAAGLGLLNLFGVFQLGSLFGSVAAVRTLGPFLDGVRAAYPFLAAYALVYVGTPVWRWVQLQAANAGIAQRNAVRAEAAKELARPSAPLAKKLAAAKGFRLGEQRIRRRDVIYRSDSSDPPPAADPFADFDKRLRDRQ